MQLDPDPLDSPPGIGEIVPARRPDSEATTEQVAAFVHRYPDAAMITLRQDGSAHMARVELGIVDGRIRSSGSPSLVRTRHLRRDPRCSLFVFGPHPRWLGLETLATILDGPEAPQLLIGLMQARYRDRTPPGMVLGHDDELQQERLYSEDQYVADVQRHHRFVFDFAVLRAYGNWQ
jgi:hypothetical protein